MAKTRRIITTNKEIYEKLNILQLSTDVVIKDAASLQIKKILNNINKYNKCVSMEKIGSYFLLKKEGPINFAVYYRKL